MSDQQFKTITINGVDIFYREAGDKKKPIILLLHGFPSSSHMYRDLINDLSSDYHLIAPDYPGFDKAIHPQQKSINTVSITWLQLLTLSPRSWD